MRPTCFTPLRCLHDHPWTRLLNREARRVVKKGQVCRAPVPFLENPGKRARGWPGGAQKGSCPREAAGPTTTRKRHTGRASKSDIVQPSASFMAYDG